MEGSNLDMANSDECGGAPQPAVEATKGFCTGSPHWETLVLSDASFKGLSGTDFQLRSSLHPEDTFCCWESLGNLLKLPLNS